MKVIQVRETIRSAGIVRLLQLGLVAAGMGVASPVLANHSVLVEGESDFDGDGVIGTDEDNDGDQVFGSITRALSMDGGVSQNGRVTVVTSGRFFEQVVIEPAGVVVLEAAPGVTADIEAFNAGGDENGNVTRQNQPGIIVQGDGSFPVEVRNLVSRNWTIGVLVKDQAQVTLDGLLLDSNVNYGIQVVDSARALIKYTQLNSSGFRMSGTEGMVDAHPGRGIEFAHQSSGVVAHSEIAHSVDRGITNETDDDGALQLIDVTLVNNGEGPNGYFRDIGQ